MALRMARPWKDPKTAVWHLRQRTPTDLLSRIRGQKITLPVGEQFASVTVGEMVQASLRTKVLAEAKERYAIANAALSRIWEAERNGPIRLNHEQATALAGRLYHGFAAIKNPGSPERWAWVQDVNKRAREGRYGRGELLIGTKARKARSMEDRFGPFADALLAGESMRIDGESRALLLRALAVATDAGARKLERNAEFDYSPDPNANRFPDWERVKPEAQTPTLPGASPSVSEVWDRWRTYHADKKATSTMDRYEPALRSLAAFVNGKAAGAVSSDDLYEWAQHRRDKVGISPKVVNQVDLVAVSSVFRWASSRQGGKLIATNPVTKDVRLDLPKAQPKREKALRAGEIVAILRAAQRVQDNARNPTSVYARRWCPWLAAYSGARIQELTGLMAEDVRQEGGVWVMDFPKTKTDQPRTVPVHEHLVALGFNAFVASRKAGPLFYDPKRSKGGAKIPQSEQRAIKLAEWVRKQTSLDMAVAPITRGDTRSRTAP